MILSKIFLNALKLTCLFIYFIVYCRNICLTPSIDQFVDMFNIKIKKIILDQ